MIDTQDNSIICFLCNFKTSRLSNMKKHLLSGKHCKLSKNSIHEVQPTSLVSTSTTPFHCPYCHYMTNRSYNMTQHLSSLKHKKRKTLYFQQELTPFTPTPLSSTSSSSFSSSSSSSYMYTHNNQTNYNNQSHDINHHSNHNHNNSSNQNNINHGFDKEFIMDIFKENTAVMCETIMKQLPLITSSIANNLTITNHSNNTNTMVNSNNKQFNLNFYLNETCKNAMNMSDFVNSLVIRSEELEDMGKLGYVQGISNILIRGLKELDETERPMHCTDKKRETLYIKENNIWHKDSEKTKIIKTIQDIAHKNFKHIALWKEANPASCDSSTQKHLEYMQILCQVMTGISPDDDIGIHKIIRKVALSTYIDKDMF